MHYDTMLHKFLISSIYTR